MLTMPQAWALESAALNSDVDDALFIQFQKYSHTHKPKFALKSTDKFITFLKKDFVGRLPFLSEVQWHEKEGHFTVKDRTEKQTKSRTERKRNGAKQVPLTRPKNGSPGPSDISAACCLPLTGQTQLLASDGAASRPQPGDKPPGRGTPVSMEQHGNEREG